MSKIKGLSILLLVCLLLSFAGAAFAKPIDIHWWHAMRGARGDVLQAIVDSFNSSQSDYRVVATYIATAFAPGLRAFIMLGVLAAGFSTLEGVILALSTIFGNDFYGTIARVRGVAGDQLNSQLLRVGRIFLIALAPITLLLAWRQIVAPSLSVAIFAQNGIYGLFAATFAPVLFGIFSKRTSAPLAFGAAVTALVVHFGMYYGGITHYHNNPAVPATFALVISTLVMAIGVATLKHEDGTESTDEGLSSSEEKA